MDQFIRKEMVGAVALLTITRPPVNALSLPLADELAAKFNELADENVARAIVLTGGDKFFSAGADIKELRGQTVNSPSEAMNAKYRFEAVFRMIGRLKIPVIGAANGYALGGGLVLLVNCDIRVGAADATFGMPEINLGGAPILSGARLAGLIGKGQSMKMVLTGDRIDGEEAYRIGLIDVLAESGQAIPTALELAERIASKPVLSVQACKLGISLGAEMSLDSAESLSRVLLHAPAASADRIESLNAFLEKREPRLVGG